MTSLFKVGDIVCVKTSTTGDSLIVEQVFERGHTPHYMCSHCDRPWTPMIYGEAHLGKVRSKDA